MTPNFKLQPKAEKDLEEIWNYSASQWGFKQANEYVDSLLELFNY